MHEANTPTQVGRTRDRGRQRLRGWRAFAGYQGYVLVLGVALTATSVALSVGGDATRVTFAVIAACVVLIGVFEHIHPYSAQWGWTRRSATIDTLHSVVSAVVMAPLIRAGAAALVVAIAAWLRPSGQPTT